MRIHAAAVFLGAFLLFFIQPLTGRWFLPWYGGSPAVWTVALLVFQALLLAGYALAHALSRLRLGWQAMAFIGLALVAWATFPLSVDASWKPAPGLEPVGRLLPALAWTVGVPFLAAAMASPMLQHWAARGRAEPYRLYAVSNLGSFAALVSYPLIAEPLLTLGEQAVLARWLVLAYAATVALAARATSGEAERKRRAGRPQVARKGDLFAWLALPAVSTALLMGVTNQISRDVAVVPFLWVLPLALYLLSYVLAFTDKRESRGGSLASIALLMLPFAAWLSWFGQELSLAVQVGGHSAVLFVVCWALHADLFRRRPDPAALTRFYLQIALGGALGGALVALVAPRVFVGWHELSWALVAAGLLLMSGFTRDPVPGWRRAGRWPAIAGFAVVGAAGVAFLLAAFESRDAYKEQVRSFFGVHRVATGATSIGEPLVLLEHGGITHGTQFMEPARRGVATTYYSRAGGGGLAWERAGGDGARLLGMVGLGTGTLLALSRPGDTVVVYEIDPDVIDLASSHFTFVRDTPATVEFRLGDARLSLEAEDDRGFDLLVLDAFSGDSVPAHLLTEEAFALYARHVGPEGALAVHVTNRHLDLAPLVAALAKTVGWEARVVVTGDDPAAGATAAEWVVAGPPGGLVDDERVLGASQPASKAPGLRPWTDDYASLLPLVRW